MLWYLIHEIGPTRASMVTYLFPVGGVILGVFFLREQLSWQLVAGTILIIASLAVVDPVLMLVAVALSAQATDAGVNKATRPLFAVADTPEKMLALGEEKLRDYIKTIGLYRNKAKNVIALCEKLIADFGGEVPKTREELMTLPGVGRKTANVVLQMAFGQSTIAVDTHLFRIANRIRLAPGNTPDEVEANLMRVIPEKYLYHAHHWLILHGRYVCKARRPECERCIIADICKSPEKSCDIPATLVELPSQVIPAAG